MGRPGAVWTGHAGRRYLLTVGAVLVGCRQHLVARRALDWRAAASGSPARVLQHHAERTAAVRRSADHAGRTWLGRWRAALGGTDDLPVRASPGALRLGRRLRSIRTGDTGRCARTGAQHHPLRAATGPVRQRNHSRTAIGAAGAVGEVLTARTAIGERAYRTVGRALIHHHSDASITAARSRASGASAAALGCAHEIAGATRRRWWLRRRRRDYDS
jgi:hypothetical protein